MIAEFILPRWTDRSQMRCAWPPLLIDARVSLIPAHGIARGRIVLVELRNGQARLPHGAVCNFRQPVTMGVSRPFGFRAVDGAFVAQAAGRSGSVCGLARFLGPKKSAAISAEETPNRGACLRIAHRAHQQFDATSTRDGALLLDVPFMPKMRTAR